MSEQFLSTAPDSAPDSANHDILCRHLNQCLLQALQNKTGRVLEGQILKIEGSGLEFIPDAAIYGAQNENAEISAAPVVVFEVLSPASEAFDRGAKFAAYAHIKTLSHYVLLETERMAVEHFQRVKDGWLLRFWGRSGDVLRFGDLEVEISLGDLYENIELPDRASAAPVTPRREADLEIK